MWFLGIISLLTRSSDRVQQWPTVRRQWLRAGVSVNGKLAEAGGCSMFRVRMFDV